MVSDINERIWGIQFLVIFLQYYPKNLFLMNKLEGWEWWEDECSTSISLSFCTIDNQNVLTHRRFRWIPLATCDYQ